MGRGDAAESWEAAFLEHYRSRGGKVLSAKEAGTTWPKVKAHMEASERFREAYDQAHLELLDMLERQLVAMAKGEIKSTGFLALIARLKAELPGKYNDKLQVSGAVAHVHGAPAPEVVNALLREMLGDSRPETRAALAKPVGVIDAEATPVER
jgi:predicted transcriptional regulator